MLIVFWKLRQEFGIYTSTKFKLKDWMVRRKRHYLLNMCRLSSFEVDEAYLCIYNVGSMHMRV